MRDTNTSRVIERARGRQGELVLRAVGDHYEIISNGVFLMDTRNGESERQLVRLALRDRPGRLRLLIGGLGVGFSLAEALRSPQVERVTVVEIEPEVVEWSRTYLASFSGGALSDPRVEVVNDDLVAWLHYHARTVRRDLPRHRQRTGLDRDRRQRGALFGYRPCAGCASA